MGSGIWGMGMGNWGMANGKMCQTPSLQNWRGMGNENGLHKGFWGQKMTKTTNFVLGF